MFASFAKKTMAVLAVTACASSVALAQAPAAGDKIPIATAAKAAHFNELSFNFAYVKRKARALARRRCSRIRWARHTL